VKIRPKYTVAPPTLSLDWR